MVSRRELLVCWLVSPLLRGVGAQPLLARVENESLRVTAPHLNFLSGVMLDRLRDGATVSYAGQLTVTTEGQTAVTARVIERFRVSYDLWEERFTVSAGGAASAQAAHLTMEAAQKWCLDRLAVPTSSLPANKRFLIRLEMRGEDQRERAQVVDDPGINLTRLIELFGRAPRPQQPRWQLEIGPISVAEVPKLTQRPGAAS